MSEKINEFILKLKNTTGKNVVFGSYAPQPRELPMIVLTQEDSVAPIRVSQFAYHVPLQVAATVYCAKTNMLDGYIIAEKIFNVVSSFQTTEGREDKVTQAFSTSEETEMYKIRMDIVFNFIFKE